MLRLGDALRLTARERSAYRLMTGCAKAPVCVTEHDDALTRAAQAWAAQDDGPASRLVQAVLLAERLVQQ